MSLHPDHSLRPPSLLHRSLPVLESLWRGFPDNLFIVRCEPDDRFVVEAINPALERVLGRRSENVAGQALEQVIPPEQLASVQRHYRDCIAQRAPISYEETGGASGAELQHWQTLMVPSIDATGRVDYILGISRDITAVRRAEMVLLQTNEELERRVAERTAELEAANARLHDLATHDELTGLYNRRHFFELAAREFGLANRHQRPMSAFMIDLDHFKEINDRFGHAAGDQVLRALAEVFRASLRQTDVIGRYGGEEFAAVLIDTEEAEVRYIADRLRTQAASSSIVWEGHQIHCTLSMGVAHMNLERDVGIDFLIKRADQALLQAKRCGRNQFAVSD